MKPSRIYLSPPHLSKAELEFVHEAFRDNWIAPVGPAIEGFQADICEYVGANHSAALSSGTAALHLALLVSGITSGDEVLTSTFTFSASVNAIRYQDAIPIFIESETDTWNMCPLFLRQAIEERIVNGKKPKAILLVHLYGMPANMEAICAVAAEFEIPLIEDAAEAMGSTYQEKAVGTFGQLGIFSFNGNKIITTSGGGALISDDKHLIDEAIHLATQAREVVPHYEHTKVGFNYRLSNVSAAIGRGQMTMLDDRIQSRRAVNLFYKQRLSTCKGLRFLCEPDGHFQSNFWLTTLVLEDAVYQVGTRDQIIAALEEQNVEARPLWKPMHLQPVFKSFPYYGDRLSEHLFRYGLCLPSGSALTSSDLERIVTTIQSVCNRNLRS